MKWWGGEPNNLGDEDCAVASVHFHNSDLLVINDAQCSGRFAYTVCNEPSWVVNV